MVSRSCGSLDLLGARVVAGDDRDAVAPGDPARDLAVQVRAGAAALGVGPVAVGEQQDVPRVARISARGTRWARYLVGRRQGQAVRQILRLRRVPSVRRRIAALLAVARPRRRRAGRALAQGAGDEQYQDPFGGSDAGSGDAGSEQRRRRSRSRPSPQTARRSSEQLRLGAAAAAGTVDDRHAAAPRHGRDAAAHRPRRRRLALAGARAAARRRRPAPAHRRLSGSSASRRSPTAAAATEARRRRARRRRCARATSSSSRARWARARRRSCAAPPARWASTDR